MGSNSKYQNSGNIHVTNDSSAIKRQSAINSYQNNLAPSPFPQNLN